MEKTNYDEYIELKNKKKNIEDFLKSDCSDISSVHICVNGDYELDDIGIDGYNRKEQIIKDLVDSIKKYYELALVNVDAKMLEARDKVVKDIS